MGSWDVGSFDNDQAMDELEALAEDPRHAATRLGRGRPDATEAVRALALGELLAAASGFGGSVPAAVMEQAESVHATVGVRRGVLERIRAVRQDSELRDLWDEQGKVDAWLTVVDDLIGRLVRSIDEADDTSSAYEVDVGSAKELKRLLRQLAAATPALSSLAAEIEWDEEEVSVVLEADDEEVEGLLYPGEMATGLADLLNELLEVLEGVGTFEGDDEDNVITFSVE